MFADCNAVDYSSDRRQRLLRSTPGAHQSEHIDALMIAHEVDRDVGEASRMLNWVNWSVIRSRSSMHFISATTSPPHQRTPGSMSGMRFDVSNESRPNARRYRRAGGELRKTISGSTQRPSVYVRTAGQSPGMNMDSMLMSKILARVKASARLGA